MLGLGLSMNTKSKRVLLITEWPDPRFQRGVLRFARDAGWRLTQHHTARPELPLDWKGDGCLSPRCSKAVAEFTDRLAVPVVHLNTPRKGAALPSICEDNHAIGRLAAEYYLERGFKHFAYYQEDSSQFANERFKGFLEPLNDEGFQVRQLNWKQAKDNGDTSGGDPMQWLSDELACAPKPLALFCVDDLMALPVMEACKLAELDIPYDVSIVGVGDLLGPEQAAVISLTTVTIDFEAFAYRAASMLDVLMSGGEVPAEHVGVSPSGIKEGRSSSMLALNHVQGQKAVQYMLENLHDPIDANRAAAEAGLTILQLTQITKAELGLSPAKLLETLRLQQAMKLLIDTNYTMDGIASLCGLNNRVRLERVFRRHLNMTPSAWREHNGLEKIPHISFMIGELKRTQKPE